MRFALAFLLATVVAFPAFAHPQPTRATVVVTRTIDGETTVLGSKVLDLKYATKAVANSSFEYINSCSEDISDNAAAQIPTCTVATEPTGLTVSLGQIVTETATPTYSLQVKFHELTAVTGFAGEHNTGDIQLPSAAVWTFEENIVNPKVNTQHTVRKDVAPQSKTHHITAQIEFLN